MGFAWKDFYLSQHYGTMGKTPFPGFPFTFGELIWNKLDTVNLKFCWNYEQYREPDFDHIWIPKDFGIKQAGAELGLALIKMELDCL